ncbi:hypothetical protein HYR99_39575 [Candidatus Poribacteria bacterium]|nr:hypothetical protein [Candidatus Poribacteria bacterium]
MPLFGHTARVNSVAFNPSGTHIATASEDKTVRIYTLDIEDLIVLAKKRVTRELTTEERQKYLGGAPTKASPIATSAQ